MRLILLACAVMLSGCARQQVASANSTGGVMGKMIDAQSIVVASTATRWVGAEGTILRRVFVHSVALGLLLAAEVMLFAYFGPLKALVP